MSLFGRIFLLNAIVLVVAGAAMLWLARGIERDLRHDDPLPPLPSWG